MDALYHKNTTCLFTGHRYIPIEHHKKLSKELESVIERLFDEGIKTFISGGALGFDMMAAEAVLAKKEKHPEMQLVMALPCRDQHIRWCQKDKSRYEALLKKADDIFYLLDKYTTGCMHLRNRFMVEKSSVCIAYFQNKKGGTAHTVNLAREHGLKIINLAEL